MRYQKLPFADLLPGQMSHNDFCVLMKLKRAQEMCKESGVKVSKLAELMCVSAPSISRTLKHLEKDGLVERYSDTSDRRNTFVKLTGEGDLLVTKADGTFQELHEAILSRMGEDRVEAFIAFLNDMCEITADEMHKIKESANIDNMN